MKLKIWDVLNDGYCDIDKATDRVLRMRRNDASTVAFILRNYEVALKQYYVEIEAAKECHYRGDNDGVRHHRDAARVLQKDITSYLSMCVNTIHHDNQ